MVLVVLIPLNHVYIGAHWPIDLAGGAAVGLLAATITWLIAARGRAISATSQNMSPRPRIFRPIAVPDPAMR